MLAMPRSWSGMPSWTDSPSISIVFSSSLDAVRRVSMKPNATALQLTLNWPHSLASVLGNPTTPGLPAVAEHARGRGHVDDLAEDLVARLALGLGRLAQVRRGGADDLERHGEVDVEHPVPPVVAHLVDRRGPGGDRRLDELVGRVALGQVAGEDRGLPGDLARRLARHVAVEVVDDHLGAL